MRVLPPVFRDRLQLSGIGLLLLSLLLFQLTAGTNASDTAFPVFMGCYLISVVYYFGYLFQGSSGDPRQRNGHLLLSLLQFYVSAFALNRCMDVFSASPFWFCCLLVAVGAGIVAATFFDALPRLLQGLVLLLLGCGCCVFLYQAIYLLPIYAVSVPGLLVFGVSIHAFVPALLLVHTGRRVARLAGGHAGRWGWFAGGVLGCFVAVLVHTLVWDQRVSTFNKAYARSLAEGGEDLPAWVRVAQQVRGDAMDERILKTDLVYHLPHWDADGMFFQMPTRSLGELQHVHDPLVVLASMVTAPVRLSQDERLRLLQSRFNNRHHTEERLWSGIDLTTEDVHTQVRLWPAQRLAYTEQIITVANHGVGRWDNRTEEAIYTFHLPEGALLSSLSLWINGQEAKGVLTTRGKADSAYRQVVGVEQHDPSVAHWQEGNRVTVRVFPVNARDRRVFKIGITSLLQQEGKELVYHSTRFEGPDATEAGETVEIRADGGTVNAQGRQVAFRGEDADERYEGRLRPEWSYRLPDPGLSSAAFAFAGQSYHAEPLQYDDAVHAVKDLYLDLNRHWTRAEFDAVLAAAAARPVWVEDEDLIELTPQNRDALFNRLSRRAFSLFPVFSVPDPATALLVTKGDEKTPELSDLKGTAFYEHLRRFSTGAQPILLFDLGEGLTPYLKGLRDFRCLRYQRGNADGMKDALRSGHFAVAREAEGTVALYDAGIQLRCGPGNGKPGAPDHLMRLYHYNHLLQQYGRGGIDNAANDSTLIAEAETAHVVSPLSSLIVLETKADYERFGIDATQKGLQNATLKSSGAVPEPHEWVLLILTLGIALYLYFRMRS